MAGLNEIDRLAGEEDGHRGSDAARATTPDVAGPPAVDAARAVRVRLAPSSVVGGEEPVTVAPAAGPLRATNPTVGVGPLGGLAAPPATHGVLAQRQLLVDAAPSDASLRPTGHDRYVLDAGGERHSVILGSTTRLPGGVQRREVLVGGFTFQVDIESERVAGLRERAGRGRGSSVGSGPLDVRAIIPGKVVTVSVAPGDTVTAGTQLLVVEAMKMQNELRAPRDGTIERVEVAPGVNIEVGDLLMVIS